MKKLLLCATKIISLINTTLFKYELNSEVRLFSSHRVMTTTIMRKSSFAKKLSITSFVLIALSIFAFLGCQSHPKKIKTSTYQLRPFKEATLSNGLPVLLIPDRKLPYFRIILFIESGSSSDPEKKMGLSHMTAQLLDKGTQQRRARDIANSLEQLGSYFYTNSHKDITELSASGLSFHKDQLLKDFSEILLQPVFYNHEIKDMKEKVLSNLTKALEEPGALTHIALQSYLYGDHPYAKRVLGRKRDIQSITRRDILNFYKNHYTPRNSRLAIVGNFDDNIIPQLEAHLGQWRGIKSLPIKYPDFPKISGLQIRLIDNPDAKQTQIRLAHRGLKRINPDFLTVRLANIILGNGFTSRLMNELRLKRGLTYSVNSRFNSQKDFGSFSVSTFTRHEKVGEIIQETLNILKTFRKSGVTHEEIAGAKSTAKGRFLLYLNTAESLAHNLLWLRSYGVPDTYLTNFYNHVDRISPSDVHHIIKRYFDEENMKIVVYGPKDKILQQIRSIGTTTEVTSYKDFL